MEKVDGNFATAVTCKRSWYATVSFVRLRSAKMSMAMSIGARQRMEANRAATRVAAWEKGRKERKELKERAEIEANMRDTVAAYGAVRVGLAATRMAAAHRGRAARREAEYNRVLVNIRVVDRERKQRLPDSGRCYIVANPVTRVEGLAELDVDGDGKITAEDLEIIYKSMEKVYEKRGMPRGDRGPHAPSHVLLRGQMVDDPEKGQVLEFQGDHREELASLLVNLKMVAKHKVRTHYETDARSR